MKFIIYKQESKFGSKYLMGIEDNSRYEFPIDKNAQGPLLVNDPNITRLFSDTHDDRSVNYDEGVEVFYTTKNGLIHPYEVTYTKFTSGELEYGQVTDKYKEIFLTSPSLSGRWILRKLPNIFHDSLFTSKEITLLWKPTLQGNSPSDKLEEVICPCPMKDAKSLNSSQTLINVPAQFAIQQVDIDNNTITGIAAAEGTWIDFFGRKFTYTSDFMDVLFARMKSTFMTVDKEHDGEDRGIVTDVQLVQEPIKHIVTKGTYNGSIEDVDGLSLEMTLNSAWSNQFQSWIPFDANPERVSLVGSPACKICWISEVKNI